MTEERPDRVERRMRTIERARPGFWEVRGCSSSAEPWLDDRYSS